MVGMFLTCCDDTYVIKPSNQVVDRAFDIPKSNNQGTAVYFFRYPDSVFNDEELSLVVKKTSETDPKYLTLEENTGGSSPGPTVIQNVIITPTGRAAAFWNRSNDPTKLYYAFTNTALNAIEKSGSFTLPTNGSAGATGLTAISLATNANNQVVVTWDLGADSTSMSPNPVSQFAVFDANGTLTKGQTNLFSYTSGEFTPSDSSIYPPKVAMDASGNILFGQSGSFNTLLFKYFSGSTLNSTASNNGYNSTYKLLTCKSTSQGLFAILTDTPPTVSSTLQTSGTLQLVYSQLLGDKISVAGSSGVNGNPLTTDLVQFWNTSNTPDLTKSFFITGLSADPSGVTANGLMFSSPTSLITVSPTQTINNDDAKVNLQGFTGGTVNYAGINNGRFIAAVTGSLWGGLGNFATGQVSFVRKLSDQVPFDAQVSIGPNGEYVFFWTDASGRVETYPSSGSSPTIRGALQKFSPVKVQKGLARP
jgi:hypothetical protein